jgi:serine protease AprX
MVITSGRSYCISGMSKWFILFGMLWAGYAEAQVNRYVVFFTDKAGTPYSVSHPASFLSVRALARRSKLNVPVTEEDLPVSPAYVDHLRNAGATVLYTSRWFNAAVVQCPESLLGTLLSLPGVNRIELVAPGPRPSAGGREEDGAGMRTMESTASQLTMHNLNAMHDEGVRGEGIMVGVFDGGFRGADTIAAFRHIFDEGRLEHLLAFNLVTGGNQVFRHDDHGTQVWSVIAAYLPGHFTGGAYKARFMLAVTEDVSTEYRIEEYNWVVAAERADSAGVDVINTSLGYNLFDSPDMNYTPADMNGQTAVISRAAQKAAQRGIVVVVSAGNEGARPWQIITAPADADQILAVGNVNAGRVRSLSSSTGPASDGRIKPDVAALGTGVAVVRGNGVVGTASGTSLSAPLVTSLVAGLLQKFPDRSPAEIIDAIRLGASQSDAPDNQIGYGIIDYLNSRNLLERLSGDAHLQVFPNPMNHDGQLYIRSTNPQISPSVAYQVFTINGMLIQQGTISFTIQQAVVILSFQNLPAGLYLLRLNQNNQWITHKIVKP